MKIEEALKRIAQLVSFGRLRPIEQAQKFLQFNKRYLFARQALWFWVTILLTTTGALTSLAIPEGTYPTAYFRQVLGSIFVLWLPGYTLVKLFFPKRKESNMTEQMALSIGLSTAIIPIVGLLLNYTPWGLSLIPITLSLFGLTVISATAALAREYYMNKNFKDN
ncbi:MAG: DUF1616 domain-containing protein [Candidatus Bathyarchaeia archaeon]